MKQRDFTSLVIVPLTQAAITGGLFGILANLFFDKQITIVTVVVVTIIVWLFRQRMIWQAERVTGKDIDQDGHVGKPQNLNLRVSNGNGNIKQGSIPGSEYDFMEWLQEVYKNENLTYRLWVKERGLYTQNEYKEFLEEMGRMGIIEKNGITSSAVLTDYGVALAEKYT